MKVVSIVISALCVLVLTGCESSNDIYMENVNDHMEYIKLAEANDCTMNLHRFYTHHAYMTFNCEDEVLSLHEFVKKFK